MGPNLAVQYFQRLASIEETNMKHFFVVP